MRPTHAFSFNTVPRIVCEIGSTQKIAQLVRQKDGLDYHQALQLLLRGWLFIHIPLTYSLLIFSLMHLVLVYAFSGGAR